MEKNKIKIQAKQIMDNFMESLNEIEIDKDFNLKREKYLRAERKILKEKDEEFIQRFLKNAPKTTANSILANKGEWEK